jgi:hypothetical protein
MSDLPSYPNSGPEFQFGSLTSTDRVNIVVSSGTQGPNTAFLTASQFRLSALGATLELQGNWNGQALIPGSQTNQKTDLQAWRQVTVDGRDDFVKLVYGGFLYPLGHQASLVKIFKRILVPDPVNPDSYADAYVQIYVQIHVTQPVLDYPVYAQPYGSGAWPFTSATMLTVLTPDIDGVPPPGLPTPGINTGGLELTTVAGQTGYPAAFFPSVNSEPVLWNLKLTDMDGTDIHLQMPLGFMFGSYTGGAGGTAYDPNASVMAPIAKVYNSLGQGNYPSFLVTSPVPGVHLQYASDVTTGSPGYANHPTLSITLGAASVTQIPPPTAGATSGPQVVPIYVPGESVTEADLQGASQPAFFPTLMQARVRLPAAETLSRNQFTDDSGPGVAIYLYEKYVTDGFTTPANAPIKDGSQAKHLTAGPIDPTGTTNPGAVFAGLLQSPPVQFPSDLVGGLGNPNAALTGLSAVAGAIGGTLDQYAENAVALIQQYLGDLTSSNLLGGLSLLDILAGSPPDPTAAFLGQNGIPGITQSTAPDGTRTVSYSFQAQLVAVDTLGFAPASAGGQYGNGMFNLTATLTVTPTGTTTYQIQGEIDAFSVNILAAYNVIQIPFGDQTGGTTPGATFTASSAAKTSIQVNVGQPTFEGALDFVNTLQQFLSDIGGSGVSINVGPTQISASITLSLPSVGVGVFNLENLALSASVVVPFLNGQTVATFGFCSAEQPFSLTVMCFGGGGYLLVSVGLQALESLTASFDFEGQLALDLGVASGGVSAMAGITFSYVENQGSTLTGFVRITGEVEVLGIISVSLELQLSLSYASATNEATGTATMTLSIGICFFSISVGITVQKSFGGGDSNAAMSHPAQARALARGDKAGATNPNPNQTTTNFEAQMAPSDWSAYCSAFAG